MTMRSKTIFVLSCWFLVGQITTAPLVIEIFRREPDGDRKRIDAIEIDDNIIEDSQRQGITNDELLVSSEADRDFEQMQYDMAYNFDCSMPIPPNIIENDPSKTDDDVFDTDRELTRRDVTEQLPSIVSTARLGLNSLALNAMSFGFSLISAVLPTFDS